MRDFLESRYFAARNLQLVSIFASIMLLVSIPAFAQASQTTQNLATTSAAFPAFEAAEGTDTSANWAGYVAEGDKYTGVNGSWIVPAVSADQAHDVSADATWVGIGGVESRDLIQAGTQAIVQGTHVQYEAWYELLPHYQTHIPLAIHAGDSVSVSLAQISTGKWQLTFANNSTGKTYQTSLDYDSTLSSAEWIEEMPVGSIGHSLSYLPLDNFDNARFTNAGAIVNGTQKQLSETDAHPITMLGADMAIATPSVIGNDGTSFSVARTNTSLADREQSALDHMPTHRGHERGFDIDLSDGSTIHVSWIF